MAPPQSLKDTGLKATLPRLKILDLFQRSSERHLSAEDVYRLLVAEELDVGLATIYRVLTQFEQAGILRRHHFESGKAVFELDKGDHHDHIMCIECGHVEEFYDHEIESRQNEIAAKMGFKVRDHAMYLYAECTRPNCPNKAANKKGSS
jgi:Fur family transcriptional regulator, ferric uptake regulator